MCAHLDLPVVGEVQVRVVALCLRNILDSIEEVNGCGAAGARNGSQSVQFMQGPVIASAPAKAGCGG
jgi:hypothetical protein